ncbi:MAG: muramoyltetrapeptide carboxypeptidase, partial [Bradymonadia bacterium]
MARLITAGFDVRFDPLRANARWRGYYAGSDATRAAEFIAALSEPDVDIVWWGRGGSGSARVLPGVLHAARGLAPRIVIGFSDATALLNAFAVQLGWLTFHGPAITSIARTDLDRLRAVVCGEIRTAPLLNSEDIGDASQAPPAALEGCVFGGNLSVLTTLLGTPSQPPSSRTIWLLEDVNEPSYRIDRSLRHLKDAGGTLGAVGAWCGPLHASLDARIVPADA